MPQKEAVLFQSLIRMRSMRLITYGCGEHFDRDKFEPIKNRDFVKPAGGLWASPVGCHFGWKEWCEAEGFGDLNTQFEFDFYGSVLTINTLADLVILPWRQPYDYSGVSKIPDLEAILAAGVDAIYLTERGEQATRYSMPNLYGWDCESVFVMNVDAIMRNNNGMQNFY